MELIYIWIDKFRTFEKTEVSLTNKFLVDFDIDEMTITINKNEDYVSLYSENIKNVNLILGKNSVGKSNFLDLIGQRVDGRNEREIRYIDEDNKSPFRRIDAKKEVNKKAQFFLIYYLGEYEGESLFCFEGNDIETYDDLIVNKDIVESGYYNEKYWFSLLCRYSNGKFEYIRRIQKIEGDNDFVPSQDQLAVILLRDNFSDINFSYDHLRTQDEQKITVPRRNSKYQPQLLFKKTEFLYKQLTKEELTLYSDNHYSIEIFYHTFKESDRLINFITGRSDETSEQLQVYELLENLCLYCLSFEGFFEKVTNRSARKFNEIGSEVKNEILSLTMNTDDDIEIYDYFKKCFMIIIKGRYKTLGQELRYYESELTNYEVFFSELTDSLIAVKNNRSIALSDGYIRIKLTKQSEITSISQLLRSTVDAEVYGEILEMDSPFEKFFNYRISNLSDGEEAYLNLMASIDEQVTHLCNLSKEKTNFILLLDEPEARMHPELMRTFISNLLVYLETIKGKGFQVVITSHSPFFASDVPKENIVLLDKLENQTIVSYPKTNTFYQNIHTLLTDSFFMDKTHGEHASILIDEILAFIKEPDKTNLNKIEKYKKIANTIGEPIIKRSILFELEKLGRKDKVQLFIEQYDDLSKSEKKQLKEKLGNRGMLK